LGLTAVFDITAFGAQGFVNDQPSEFYSEGWLFVVPTGFDKVWLPNTRNGYQMDALRRNGLRIFGSHFFFFCYQREVNP
jgi:hypothetical protein